MQRNGIGVKSFSHLLNTPQEVGSGSIHFIHKPNTGNLVLAGLTPHSFRLRFDSTHRTEHTDSTIEDSERPLHLSCEVHVTRRVDNINLVVLPETGGRRGRNGNPALLLLLHPVHSGGSLMNLTELMTAAGIIENPLRRGGFSGINMRDDPDITNLV